MRLFIVFAIISISSCTVMKYPAIARKELPLLHLEKADTLVDIGCGYGYYSREVAHNLPNLYMVLEDLPTDNRGHNIYNVLRKVLRNNIYTPNVESHYKFVTGSEKNIPLKSSTYKWVLCRMTVHEFEYPDEMISELYRILSDDGILIVMEPEPAYSGQKDRNCKRKYLTKEQLLTMFSSFKRREESVIKVKGAEMNILRLGK